MALATATAASAAPGPVAYSATSAIYAVGSLVCHQRPERSFHVRGAQVPVCARCAGLYVGAALAGVAALRGNRRRPRGSAARARTLVVVAAVPTLVTLAIEWTTGGTPANLSRALAGLPLGAAIVWVMAASGTPRAPVEVN